VDVTFYGVRGSTPCASEELRRYGGNTACVVVDGPDLEPILLDLGTGLRFFGLDGRCSRPFRGTALVTHLHWDHVQGIPFFTPLLCPDARLDLYAPAQDEGLEAAVRAFLAPPYFPVGIDELPGEIRFHDTTPGTFTVGEAEIRAALVPHIGPTLGFRVTVRGVSIAYVSDHQQPGVGSTEVDAAVLDLCDGVDLLIHDAQFDDDEFALRSDWGHCTVDYAVEVAARSGAARLALFHHDPSHTDERIDELLADVQVTAAERGVGEVFAASEGLTVSFSSAANGTAANGAVASGAVAGHTAPPVAGGSGSGRVASAVR
jgi:phosphoribosyl 1,2-cyclic phosphodiesterase